MHCGGGGPDDFEALHVRRLVAGVVYIYRQRHGHARSSSRIISIDDKRPCEPASGVSARSLFRHAGATTLLGQPPVAASARGGGAAAAPRPPPPPPPPPPHPAGHAPAHRWTPRRPPDGPLHPNAGP